MKGNIMPRLKLFRFSYAKYSGNLSIIRNRNPQSFIVPMLVIRTQQNKWYEEYRIENKSEPESNPNSSINPQELKNQMRNDLVRQAELGRTAPDPEKHSEKSSRDDEGFRDRSIICKFKDFDINRKTQKLIELMRNGLFISIRTETGRTSVHLNRMNRNNRSGIVRSELPFLLKSPPKNIQRRDVSGNLEFKQKKSAQNRTIQNLSLLFVDIIKNKKVLHIKPKPFVLLQYKTLVLNMT